MTAALGLLDVWRPLDAKFSLRLPEVGDLIALEYVAWRVWDVSPHPSGDGSTRIAVHREHGPRHKNENSRGDAVLTFHGPPRRTSYWKWENPEAIALCSCHGWPYPCQVMHEQAAAQREMRWLADMAAKAGAEQCQACGERITSRQGSVTAPEDHLLLPGFGPPRFHTRHACREALDSYDRDRRRVLGDAWTPLIPDETPLPLTERHTA